MTTAGAALQGAPAPTELRAEENGTVSLGGIPLRLAPKQQAVLHLLLRSWPNAVSKDDFAHLIWPAQDMSDASLARCVAQLRQRIPVSTGVTLHAVYGRGYRLTKRPIAKAGASDRVGHPRLLLAAMAPPRQAEALIQARQWTQQRTQSSLLRAQNLLRVLLTEAPAYVAAQLAYAECLCATITCGFSVPRVLLESSLTQLQQLSLAAKSSTGLHADLAHLLDCLWRFDEARAMHLVALQTSPDEVQTHSYWGWHLLATGQATAAAQALKMATQINPFAINLHLLASRAFNAAGDIAQCLEHGRHAAELYPDNITAQLNLLGIHAYVQPDPGLVEPARRLQPASSGWAFAESALAFVFARCGEKTAARELIAASQQRPASERINFAATWNTLGKASQAMDCLQEAAIEGCGHLPLLLNLAENRALQQDPRMGAVRKTINKAGGARTVS